MKKSKSKISTGFRLLIMLLTVTQWSGVQFGYDFPQIFESILIKIFNIEATQVGLLYTVTSAPNIFINILAALVIAGIGINLALPVFQSMVFIGNTLVYFAVQQRSYPLLIAGRVFVGIGFDVTYLGMAVSVEKWFSGSSLTLAFGLGRSSCYLMAAIGAFFLPQIYLQTRMLENSIMVLIGYAVLIFLTTSLYSVLDLKYDYLLKDSGGSGGNSHHLRKKKPKNADTIPEEGEDGQEMVRRHQNPLQAEKNFMVRHLRYVRPKSWLLFGMVIGFAQMYYQFTNTGTDLFQIRFGLTYEQAKNCMAILPLLNAIFIPIFAALYGKFGKKPLGIWLASLLAVGTFIYMTTIPSTNSGYQPYIAVVLVSLFFCMFCSCLLPALVMSVPKQAAGFILALVATFQNLLLSGLPPFFAIFYGSRTIQGYTNTLYVLAAYSAVMCTMAFFFFLADITGDRLLTMPENDPRVIKIQQKISADFLASILTRPKTENATMAALTNMWGSVVRSYVSQDGKGGGEKGEVKDYFADGLTSKYTKTNMGLSERAGDEYQMMSEGLGSEFKNTPKVNGVFARTPGVTRKVGQ